MKVTTNKKRQTNFIVDRDDLKFFEYLYAMKSATKKQIKRDMYTHHTDRALSQRLDKFIVGNLLTCRLCKQLRGTYVYSVTKNCFKEYLRGRGDSIVTLRSDKIYHDLLLVELRNIFLNSDFVQEYFSENELISWHNDSEPDKLLRVYSELRSDACLSLVKNEKQYYIGVELEISQKSYDRYKETLDKYYKNPLSDIVLYIAENETLINKMIKVEEQYFAKCDTKIYYQTLDNICNSEHLLFYDRNKKSINLGPRKSPGNVQLLIY
jgi:hypothetical protein